MSKKRNLRPHGQMRMSQLVTSFGPGAMFDLPDCSVIVGGLDFWVKANEVIDEPRLSETLGRILDRPPVELRLPPPDLGDAERSNEGVAVFRFPEWFVTQEIDFGPEGERSRRLVHKSSITKKEWVGHDGKKHPVVPVRFVRACRRGHIGDIDWYAFAHTGQTECRRPLWIDERGTSGDLTEIFIRCECRAERSLAQAARFQDRALGNCNGHRPWLGEFSKESCGEPNRLLIRTASNSYFAQKITVISLPDRNEKIKEAVSAVWDFLEAVESVDDLRHERKKAKVRDALDGISDEEAFQEVEAKRGGNNQPTKSVKQAELETLMGCEEDWGEDKPEGTFFARTLPRSIWDCEWMQPIEQVVLVHRLREVTAQLGFTRFEAAATNRDGELDMGVERAGLSRDVAWLPAVENRGEGIFLQFRNDAIEAWLAKPAVADRETKLERAFDLWRGERPGSHREFPALPYVLLHTFSHLLITAVALECGYPSSSIRERIYALPDVGYGVLLYTAGADSEGTLGGLVGTGRSIHQYVRSAISLGQLCSNDPVCAEHDPADDKECRFLHGAACHGCVLIAETSCEQSNEFLDRSLVVPTVRGLDVEFFPAVGS